MKKLTIIALCALLAGCGVAHDVKIETVTVDREVPVACTVKLDPRPMLQQKDELAKALAAAPNFDERLKIVTEQLLLYMGWTPKVEAALDGCSKVPKRPIS